MSPINPIPEVPDPPTVTRAAGIGKAVQNVLVKFVVETFNRLKEGISELLRHAADSVLETWERPLLRYATPLINRALEQENVPPEIRGILESAKSGQDQVGAIVLAFLVIFVVPPVVNAMFDAPIQYVRYGSNKLFKPYRMDFSTWHHAVLRDQVHLETMQKELEDQGWHPQQMEAARLASEQRLGVSEIIVANIRGEIGDVEALQRLAQHGIPPADSRILFNIGEQLPGPSDLVRFALREVWDERVVSDGGYAQGVPEEFLSWMEKQGYSRDKAIWYWLAHWEIPSPGQMFEMFHREEIGFDKLVQGLKTNDIAPGWIDPLLGITYNLLTRVDVKRALRYGEYTVDDVLTEYKHQGYGDKRSVVLTNIAIKEALDEAAGLTRAAIVKAYQKRRMKRREAEESLEDIGILGEVAGFYLDQADYDRADALLERKIAHVESRYDAGLLDDGQAFEELVSLGVPGEEARLDVDDWRLARQTRVRRPSRANLDEFFSQDVVDVRTYRQEMSGLGYDARYVGWYLGSLAFESAKRAAEEEERTHKESQRIESDRRSSDYQKAKARIDRDIAELNAAIADARVALVEAENGRDQALAQLLSVRQIAALDQEYAPLFRAVDSAIAQSRVAIQTAQASIREKTNEANGLRRALSEGRDIVQDSALRSERAASETRLSLLDQQIAIRRTDIARLNESLPLLETAQEQADVQQAILSLRTEIAEQQESQSDVRIRIREIDELLPIQLTPESRAEIEDRLRVIGSDVDRLRSEIEELNVGIRETQVERIEIESAYRDQRDAVPGRLEQIEIRAEFDARIDVIESRISELRANIAARRLAKAELTVEWRA